MLTVEFYAYRGPRSRQRLEPIAMWLSTPDGGTPPVPRVGESVVLGDEKEFKVDAVLYRDQGRGRFKAAVRVRETD